MNNMVSYYELLGMIKDKTFPDEVVLNMYGKSVTYIASYDSVDDSLICYEAKNKEDINCNFKFYLGECFLESSMFDKNLSYVIKPKPIDKIHWEEKESLAGDLRDYQKQEVLARRTEKLKKSLNEIIEKINNLDIDK